MCSPHNFQREELRNTSETGITFVISFMKTGSEVQKLYKGQRHELISLSFLKYRGKKLKIYNP
jgi:hypothetical protein